MSFCSKVIIVCVRTRKFGSACIILDHGDHHMILWCFMEVLNLYCDSELGENDINWKMNLIQE